MTQYPLHHRCTFNQFSLIELLHLKIHHWRIDVLSSAITKIDYSFWAIPHCRCIFFERCCVSSAEEKKTVQIKIRHSSHELILIKCYQNSSCKSFLIWITPLYDLKMLWYFKIIVASFPSLSLFHLKTHISHGIKSRRKKECGSFSQDGFVLCANLFN